MRGLTPGVLAAAGGSGGGGAAAPVVDSSASYSGGFGSFTESFTLNAAAGTKRALLYIHGAEGGTSGVGANSVTYDGTAMALLKRIENDRYSSYLDTSWWVLYDADLPAVTGAYDCAGNSPSEYHHQGHFILLTGVNQTTPVGDIVDLIQDSGAPTSSSVLNTVLGDDYINIDSFHGWSASPTKDAAQTLIQQTADAGAYHLGTSFKRPAAGSMIWTYAANNSDGHVGVTFKGG
jgi:hypothetical protein